MDETATDPKKVMNLASDLLLFFGIAGLLVPLLQRVKISPVLVYLAGGIVIGPHGMGTLRHIYAWLAPFTIEDQHMIEVLGELGIMSLMFTLGLELSFERMRELQRYIFGLGTAQIVVTALAIIFLARLFDNSPEASILIGASLALSSTAIVMKLLQEKRLANRPIGTLSFSVLLMQDLALVPILLLAASFAGRPEGGFAEMATSIALGAVTVAALFFIGRRILIHVLRAVSLPHNTEWLTAFTVFFVIVCAAITQMAGLSLALGAFLAGLLVSETEFRHEIETIIDPLKGLLLGVFFMSVGMTIDVMEVAREPLLLALSVAGLYAVKAMVLFPLCLMFKVPPRRAAETSVYLAQPGEFTLLILGASLATGVIPTGTAQFFLLVTTLAMMGTPLLFKLAPYAAHLAGRLDRETEAEEESADDVEQLVIVAGFGRVGQLLGNALDEMKIPYIAFDNNAERVKQLKKQGFHVIYGDARRFDLWERLSKGRATVIAAIIAIDDHYATQGVLQSLRSQWPLLPVIVRAKDTTDMARLYDTGADDVVAETLESSLRMAQLVMEKLAMDASEIDRIIEKLRGKNVFSESQEPAR